MAVPQQELDEEQRWWEEFEKRVVESDRRIEALLHAGDLDHVAVRRDPKANVWRKRLRTIRHGATARYLRARLENAAKVRDTKAALAKALHVDPRELGAELHNVEHHQAHVASA